MRILRLSTLLCALVIASEARAMSYGLVSIDDGRCTSDCPLAIVARGRIEEDESGRLLAFLQSQGPTVAFPRNLVITSPGGDLVGALDLGLRLRQLGVRTVVGSVAASPSGAGQAVLTPGVCGSACVFVLMAGTRRVVVPGSRVAVHAPEAELVGGGERYVLTGALLAEAIRGVEPIMRSYARQMGVDPAVIGLAHRVPNWATLTLTPSELSRYRLVTSGGGRRTASRSAPGPRLRTARR